MALQTGRRALVLQQGGLVGPAVAERHLHVGLDAPGHLRALHVVLLEGPQAIRAMAATLGRIDGRVLRDSRRADGPDGISVLSLRDRRFDLSCAITASRHVI